MASTPAARRYVRRFIPSMIAYVAILFAVTWAIRAYDPSGVALVALSILPALPIIGVIAVMGLYLVEERDEYLRQRLMTAMVAATGILLALATAWGFMENENVVPHVPAFYAFIIWCAALGLCQCVIAMRDRSGAASE